MLSAQSEEYVAKDNPISLIYRFVQERDLLQLRILGVWANSD
jgi:hypothetical protein